MPSAIWVGEQSPRTPMDRYDIVCVHTIVGYAPAHAAHFSTSGAGNLYQSRDTAFRSAANLNGNHRIISVENADHGPEFGGTPRLPQWVPLTDAQVERNGEVLRWAHETHGVPLVLCPDSRPSSRGLAYHRQGIDGNFGSYRFPGRVPGGELWTSSPGKLCPTDIRIAQLHDILDVATEGKDPMADYEKRLARIEELLVDIRARDIRQTQRVMTAIRSVRDKVKANKADVGLVLSELDDLEREMKADAPPAE